VKFGLKSGKNDKNSDFFIDGKPAKQMFLFTYSLRHLKYKDKIRFFYALKGRGTGRGILKTTNSEQLGRAVLLTPVKNAPELDEFFRLWKCNFKARRIWL